MVILSKSLRLFIQLSVSSHAPDSQQPKPGCEWYHPTTISGLPVCFNMSNILAWKTGSTASTETPVPE